MKKFNFRLQKVLEYRRLLEQWAKDSFLEARTSRLEADLALIQVGKMRGEVLQWPSSNIEARQSLELQLKKLDQKEIEQKLVLNVLVHEEEQARKAWTEKKIELEALQKIYDKQYAEWETTLDRKMQVELDEWSLRKRAA